MASLKHSELAGRYAKALFSLGKELSQLDQIEQSLEQLRSIYDQSADFRTFVNNPAIPLDSKESTLDALFKKFNGNDTTRKFCKALAQNGRISLLPLCIQQFQTLLTEDRGQITTEIISAAPIQESQITAITSALKKALDKEITVITKIDPSILGGIIIKVGSQMLDSSVKGMLEELTILSKAATATLDA